MTVTSFSVPENALDYWQERFRERGVESEPPTEEGPRASRRRGEDDDAGA